MSWRRFGFKFAAVFFVVLGLGYLLPNFSILPVSTAAIAGLVIAGLNFFVETIILKKEVLPFTQGLISFFLSLFGLISLKMVSGIDFSWLSLLLAALIIGLVDLIIPATLK
ncbi:MAG TPA: phage holin family protein [Hydrogenispora sp.]|nr:phage holin family protein [Hydrogenispora sp.]